MKKYLFGILLFAGISLLAQQIPADSLERKFGESVFNYLQQKNTDALVNLIYPGLKEDKKQVIALSIFNTIEQVNAMGGFEDAKLLNVLKEKSGEKGLNLYLPVLKSKIIRTVKLENIRQKNDTLYLGGPIQFVGAKTDNELTEGYNLFLTKCFACHGRYAEGVTAPDLTDDYWKYVRNENDLLTVIKEGKQGAMMIAYKTFLTDEEIRKIVKYINILQGQKLKKGKEPEGEKIIFDRKVY